MVQGLCAHLQLHETSTAVILHRLNVIIDRLNVISSDIKDANICFQGDHLAAMPNG
jgi:hypothetical protein